MIIRPGSIFWLLICCLAYATLFAVWPGFVGMELPFWLRPAGSTSVKWFLLLGYAGFGILLLAAMARLFLLHSFHRLRMTMVLFGALLAFLQSLAFSMRHSLVLPTELWLMAILGLAMIAMLVRVLPSRLAYFWLGRDRQDW
jgi:hypothetical protein